MYKVRYSKRLLNKILNIQLNLSSKTNQERVKTWSLYTGHLIIQIQISMEGTTVFIEKNGFLTQVST